MNDLRVSSLDQNSRSAWWCVTVLATTLMLAQVDRNIITLLVRPIKRDLGLTDLQISLLLGPAFIVLYVLLGLPLSRLADRLNRRSMIAIAVAFWSLMTAGCGMAQNYGQLLLFRVGIGAGEAVNGPASYSMLADYFSRERLPRALACLNLGFILGTGFSLVAGGLLIGFLTSSVALDIPLIGPMHGWQVVFVLVGLPGLFVSVLMLTVREPVRKSIDAAAPRAMPVREVAAFLGERRAIYGSLIGGMTLNFVLQSGMQNWGPTFYERTYGWPPSKIGVISGLLAVFVSPIGLLIATFSIERLNKRLDDANLRVAITAYVVAVPFHIIGPLMPNPWLAVACSGVTSIAGMTAAMPCIASLQSATPGSMRAQVSALYFACSAVGQGLGPVLVASVTDLVLGSEDDIRFALVGCAAIISPIAVFIISRARRPYGRAIALIKAAEAEAAAAASAKSGF